MTEQQRSCNWIPMTDDDWDWVNGKTPEPKKS
jgi:hypothetical protein